MGLPKLGECVPESTRPTVRALLFDECAFTRDAAVIKDEKDDTFRQARRRFLFQGRLAHEGWVFAQFDKGGEIGRERIDRTADFMPVERIACFKAEGCRARRDLPKRSPCDWPASWMRATRCAAVPGGKKRVSNPSSPV